MSQSPCGPFSHFRTYNASERAIRVARDLELHFAPYVAIMRAWGGQVLWYTFEVTEELLRRLRAHGADADVTDALDLHESQSSAPSVVSPAASARELLTTASTRAAEPHLLMDASGTVVALSSGAELPSAEATLYPSVRSLPSEVEPDQLVEFVVAVEGTPNLGVSIPVPVVFPANATTLDLHAQVSSREFEPPPGEVWSERFTIDRQLRCAPAQWVFKARARGDRKQYALTLTFQAAGSVIGALAVVVPRKGVSAPAGPPKVSSRFMPIPGEWGARLVVTIAEEGANGYKLWLYQDGNQWDEPVSWNDVSPENLALYFSQLEDARTEDDLQEAGVGLRIDVPESLYTFLDRQDVQGAPTLFVSNGRVAPFEILQLRPKVDKALLGVDRPVARWINEGGMLTGSRLNVAWMACIRPTYQGHDALPSAIEEEESLRKRFPALLHVATKPELDALLDRGEVSLVHFAGHAEGNPAQLTLEEKVRARAASFNSSRVLLNQGHPLFFLNACRAGVGLNGIPAVLANFAKVLLKEGCSAVVAPAIKIDSGAALKAAQAFYEAITTETVVEAVRRVHTLAFERDTRPEHRATYLSYLAFAPPALKLHFV